MDAVTIEKRKSKVLILLSSIFFGGFGILILLPILLNNNLLWEESTLLIIISTILGFSFIICLFSLFLVLISCIKPYKTIYNYLFVAQSILIVFTWDTLLSNEVIKDITVNMAIFAVIGVLIILSNIIYYIKQKSLTSIILVSKWENSGLKNREAITNYKDGEFLFYVFIGIFLGLTIYDFGTASIIDYFLLILINSYFLYRYLKAITTTNKQIYIHVGISALLSIITIVLLINLNDFLVMHNAIKSFVSILPVIYILPNIVSNYYTLTWKSKLETIKQNK